MLTVVIQYSLKHNTHRHTHTYWTFFYDIKFNYQLTQYKTLTKRPTMHLWQSTKEGERKWKKREEKKKYAEIRNDEIEIVWDWQ